MFKRFKKKDPMLDYIDEAIEHCAEKMLKLDPDSDEYRKANSEFLKLVSDRKKYSDGEKLSKETIALIISNLAGILLVLHYERIHVVTSKAFSWITSSKLKN